MAVRSAFSSSPIAFSVGLDLQERRPDRARVGGRGGDGGAERLAIGLQRRVERLQPRLRRLEERLDVGLLDVGQADDAEAAQVAGERPLRRGAGRPGVDGEEGGGDQREGEGRGHGDEGRPEDLLHTRAPFPFPFSRRRFVRSGAAFGGLPVPTRRAALGVYTAVTGDRRHTGRGAGASAGSSTTKVVPCPSALVTEMPPPITPGEVLREREAEARAAEAAGERGVALDEGREDLLELLDAHPDSGVDHAEDEERPRRGHAPAGPPAPPSRPR